MHLLILLIEGTLLSLLKLDSTYLVNIYLPVFTSLLQRWRKIRKERGIAMAGSVVSGVDFFSAFSWAPYKLRMLIRH